MNIQLSVILTLLLLSTILLWFLIGSNGWWWIKAIVIISTLYVIFGLYYLIPDILGHPTSDPLPRYFEIHWIVVSQESGCIDIWASDLKYEPTSRSYLPLASQSDRRVHRMIYSQNLHKQANVILKQLKDGRPFYGVVGEKSGDGKGVAQGTEKDRKDGKDSGSLTKSDDFMFYELPPPKFIKKDD